MNKNNSLHDKVILLYDGQCPICQRYKDYVQLRRQYHLELYDARQQPELIHRLREQGYDINDGMILLIYGQIYHKQDALVMLATMLESKGLADLILKKLMRTPSLMKLLYPVFFRLRWLLLKGKGIETEI